MRKTFIIFVIASALFAINFNLYCQTITSITTSGTYNWSATTTWQGGVVPTSTNDVVIGATGSGSITINVDGNYTCASLKFTAPGNTNRSETVAVGANTLTITGAVTYTGASIGNSNMSITVSTGTLNVGSVTFPGTRGVISFTGAGNLYVTSGNFGTGTAGTFTCGTSTATFNSSNTQSLGAYTYNNLTLLNSSKTAGGAIIVSGTLNLTSGDFSIGANTLTLNGAISTTSGTLTGGSTSNIAIGGAVANTTLPSVSLNNLTLNRANGLTLGGNVSVNGILTLTNGLLTLGAYDLTLGSAATIGGTPSASNMVVADNTGQMIKNFSTTGSFTFPVGDNTGTAEYSPVTLNFTAGTFDAGANAGVNLSNSQNANNTSTIDYLNRYWTISQTGISSFISDVTLQYVVADVVGTESNIYAGSWNGSTWTLLNAANTTLHQLSGTVTAFGTFTGGQPIAMPVEISSFTANVISRDVKLNWTTVSEQNNVGFEIERSVVSGVWIKAGYVTGNGSKTTPTNYIFEDKNLNTGKYNYRLKQIDYNGNFEYFNLAGEIEIGVPNKFNISQNYPNPFNPTAKIDFDLPYDSRVSIVLYDMSGREVMTLVNEQKSAGYYTVQLIGNNLSSGMYFYRIIADGNGQKYVMTKKAMLIK